MIAKPLLCVASLLAILMAFSMIHAATAQEPASPTAPIAPAKPKAPATVEGGCVTAECHAGLAKKKVIHGPMADNKCDDCHVQEGNKHQFKKIEKIGALCLSCHGDQTPTKPVVHHPFQEQMCTACHDPHASDNRMLTLGDTDKTLCSTCHEDYEKGKNFIHGPVAAGACAICHSTHESDNKKLLRVKQPDGCLECHDEFTERNMAGLGAKPFIHKPLNDGCIGCHDPHASNARFQLKSEGDSLCFSCHQDIKKTVRTAKEKHGALAIKSRCQNCHSPHFSVQPNLLLTEEADTCYTCHGKSKSGEKQLQDIKQLVATAKTSHGPLRKKTCSPCHNPHGSDNFRILTTAFPPTFYEAFAVENYELCFTCHPKTLVLDEKTDTLTDFRNGDVNLHYLHVNRKKGRTCRSCHEIHASDNPKHIRDEVPFGNAGWMLPINFGKTAGGGACTPGCHRRYGYDRNNPTDNAKK